MHVGVCLDNVDNPPDASYWKIERLGDDVTVKTLWTNGTRHRRNVYESLMSIGGVQRLVIRVGPSGQQVDAQTLCGDVSDALKEVPSWFGLDDITVVLLNEPNLPSEGAYSPSQYVQLYADCFSLLEPLKVVPWMAGPSFGVPDGVNWLLQVFWALQPPGLALNCYSEVLPVTVPTTVWGLGECGTTLLSQADRDNYWRKALTNMHLGGAKYALAFTLGSAGDSHGAWPEGYLLTDGDIDCIKEWAKTNA